MTKIILFILMFALIVLVHEWGHFIAARLFGVRVNEFAIGMGPKLWSKQKGETLYSVRALPIGGFCAMEGENGESKEKDSMFAKKPWQKLIIFAAGAIMNFILAWVIFTVIVGYQGEPSNKVLKVEPQMPATEVGIVAGDRIIQVDGITVKNLEDILELVGDPAKDYAFTLESEDGQVRTVVIKAKQMEDGSAKFGFTAAREKGRVIDIFVEGFKATVLVIKQTFQAFIDLITGQVGVDQLAGIVGVVQITSEVWDEGLEVSVMAAVMNLLYIAGILSANLGVFNLLPIPALDGGRIFFSLIEVVRRKPIDPEKEGMVHVVGFILLMVLMVVVLYNDIVRIFA
ncbi:MAG: M50 family metallopeptidase [Cellulosilyticaceae bacterium]